MNAKCFMKEEEIIITYETDSSAYQSKSLYVNLTNRCNNRCEFCHRYNRLNEESRMDKLWLDTEPTCDEVLDEIFARGLQNYDEIVFCGYGEPTERLEEMLSIAQDLRYAGEIKANCRVNIRLDTNGLADTLYNRDTSCCLNGLIDTVSVSLNAKNADEYKELCHPQTPDAFSHLLEFTSNTARFAKTYMTVIDTMSNADITECRRIAEQAGAELIVRHYME
jgi:TatD family-associated radical SAM protein